MFWGDKIVEEIKKSFEAKLKQGEKIILRDEKTLSGRPHIGSMRSLVIHATLAEIMNEQGIANEYWYEINSTDAFDTVPVYAPKELAEHLGKPLYAVPSPDGDPDKSYSDFFADEYKKVVTDLKYPIKFYESKDLYLEGKYNDYIRIALDKKDLIRKIYKEVSGSEKDETWYPVQVICDECGKIATTMITDWNGKEVFYTCSPDAMDYVEGCGHSGWKSPFDGNGTLPWKVEWPAKWCIMNVDIEAAGKDHYAAGGSRLVSNRICEEVFERKHPFDIRHEFINAPEGSKMSSSKGIGATPKDVEDIFPINLFRYFVIYKDVMKAIEFDPEGETIPMIFDQYDKMAQEYFKGDKSELPDWGRIYEVSNLPFPKKLEENIFRPRFGQLAFISQIPHIDIYEKVEEMKGNKLTDKEKTEVDEMLQYAKVWLEKYCPEKYKLEIQETMPDVDLSNKQKEALAKIKEFIESNKDADGEAIHSFIHSLKEELSLEPKELFEGIYKVVLGKESGPKVGWFLSVLDKDFLIQRFTEASN